MPDFTLRHPDTGDEYVVGNASDRARLMSQGYKDITDEPAADAPSAEIPAAADSSPVTASADAASTSDAGVADPAPARAAKPSPPGRPRTGESTAKPAPDA